MHVKEVQVFGHNQGSMGECWENGCFILLTALIENYWKVVHIFFCLLNTALHKSNSGIKTKVLKLGSVEMSVQSQIEPIKSLVKMFVCTSPAKVIQYAKLCLLHPKHVAPPFLWQKEENRHIPRIHWLIPKWSNNRKIGNGATVSSYGKQNYVESLLPAVSTRCSYHIDQPHAY